MRPAAVCCAGSDVTVDLPSPRVGPLAEHAPEPIKVVLNWGRRYSLWVFNFGLACCAIEFIAASMARHDFIRLGVIPFAPGPRQADLMVVSGTVTDKMAPAVRRLYDQMPEPKYVISFGACSNSGGPYWDSYCVTKGVDSIIPVDVYVPGCPPRPEALLQGIVRLQEKIAGETLSNRQIGARYAGGRVASAGEVQRPLVTAESIPGRGDALVPRPGEPVRERVSPPVAEPAQQTVQQPLRETVEQPVPANVEDPPTEPMTRPRAPRGGPETIAIPVDDIAVSFGLPTRPTPPSGPETTVIPMDPAATPSTTPAARPTGDGTGRRRGRRQPGRRRPEHTLADDIFDLGDEDR
jgi:NADH-quinone oxidoreductase subunit B